MIAVLEYVAEAVPSASFFTEPVSVSTPRKVTKTEIQVYSELDSHGNPCGSFQAFRNELSDPKREHKRKTDFGAIFGKFCEATFPEEFT